jgi:hypothetical protein
MPPARRALVPALLAALFAGCVIPVGPQFQDPLAAQNYAPRITDFKPPGTVTSNTHFEVTVTDPNVGDALLVRWIANYPDYQEGTRRLKDQAFTPHADGTPLSEQAQLDVTCDDLQAASAENSVGRHQIRVVVADRPFADDSMQPDRVTAGGLTSWNDWTLNISCPPTP